MKIKKINYCLILSKQCFFLIISPSYFAFPSLEMKMKKIMKNDTLGNSNIVEVLEIHVFGEY